MKLLATIAVAVTAFVQTPDTSLESLREQFVVLYESLRASGGMAESDRAVIGALQQRIIEYNKDHENDPNGLAMELQLAEWLGDTDRVYELFGRLTAATGDVRYGLAWARYFEREKDQARVGEIYSRLAGQFPDDVDLRIGWAAFYKAINRYDRALEILEAAQLDPAANPRAVLEQSTCLYAEQRFADAVALLESIPQETLAADPSLAAAVEAAINERREYVELWAAEQAIRIAEDSADDLPRAQIITSRGPITVELYENEAPNTVANFISLAKDGFYDGTKFHRVIANFMAQGGDPNSKPENPGVPGQGSPGYKIADEHDKDNARMHFTGSLAMAKETAPHTAGCQFYLTHLPPAHLNGKHTVFGHVIDGLDVARSLEVDDVIESVVVLRDRGHEYVPQTLPDVPATVVPVTPDIGTTAKPKTQPFLGEKKPE